MFGYLTNNIEIRKFSSNFKRVVTDNSSWVFSDFMLKKIATKI